MFPSTSSRETSRLSGKQNKIFLSEADIKCIIYTTIMHLQLSIIFTSPNAPVDYGLGYTSTLLYCTKAI
jgi:hypothetical protein